MDDDATLLRRRAALLRRLAGDLDDSLVRTLRARGGEATWRGPVAEAFALDADTAVRRLDQAVDELWGRAQLLERRAADASP